MKTATRILSIGGLLTMAFVASPAISVDQAHAYACKSKGYNGAVTRPTRIGAKAAARKDWEARMMVKFDLSWSLWSVAENRSVTCHKSGSQHLCIALATPCNYVVQ